MALTMPFKRNERFPALQQAKQAATAQAQHAMAAVEEHLPGRRRASWWARPFGKAVIAVVAAGAAVAMVAAFMLRQRATDALAEQDAAAERGLASTRTEVYDAHRAEEDGGVDSVQQAAKESFPASDAPVWGSGPDVPIIREGEHKEGLPNPPR